ncbi:MAG: ribosome biogenesis GTPase Der [Pseudomonadota bacterium]
MQQDRLPTIAVVGRPNVGKSSLFNALAGRRLAIVDNSRGVTRDRLIAEASLPGMHFIAVDTGGIEPTSKDPIFAAMREQAQLAIDEADAIVFLVDSRDGVLPPDRDIVELLRRSGRPWILAVNKIDDVRHEDRVYEFTELGHDAPLGISSMHKRGFEELADRLREILPEALRRSAEQAAQAEETSEEDLLALAEAAQREPDARAEPWDEAPDEFAVAVVGRPNVGKSSLINRLLGEERLLVADMPGTTRDAVDSVIEFGGRRFRLIDTAGLRRKRSIGHQLERFAVVASLNAVQRAQIVVLVLDATQPLADQDQQVASHAIRAGRAVVVALNKIDLLEPGEEVIREIQQRVRDGLGFVDEVTVLPMSAAKGKRVFDMLRAVDDAGVRSLRHIPTSLVNRTIEALMRHHPPPMAGAARAKLLFGAQVAVSPPTFVIVCRRPDCIPRSYRRYVERRLREDFEFGGVPLRVAFRSREGQARRSKRRARRRSEKDG